MLPCLTLTTSDIFFCRNRDDVVGTLDVEARNFKTNNSKPWSFRPG